MDVIIERVRQGLRTHADKSTSLRGQRFFKEQVKLYGVKTATVKVIAREHYKDLCHLDKTDIFRLCETLWQSIWLEESFVACTWSYALRKQYEPGDIIVFERWIDRYVTNWASCDTLCNHSVGTLVDMYPQQVEVLKKWAISDNRWMRRAAAVSLVVPARNGRFLHDVLDIARILLEDTDDMVRKGYGWMLKVASQAHEDDIFDFVIRNKAAMPRTSLRYAVEKMPPERKATAMRD